MMGRKKAAVRAATAMSLAAALAALVALTPAAGAQQAICTFANEDPAPNATELDPFPPIFADVVCQMPIEGASLTLDGVAQQTYLRTPSPELTTAANVVVELDKPLTAGQHTVRLQVRAGGVAATQWAFTTPSPAPCGLALPSGGVAPTSGTASLIWTSGTSNGVRACPASSVALDVARATGRTVAALWYLDNASGGWQAYLPSVSAGTLGAVPGFAALIVTFA